ncbi:MAG: rhomboid family intramembrane serine protease, partial [Bdellovibrionota bacterium]
GERVIYFMMLFPMKAKYFVALMGFVQLASMMTSSMVGSEVAYLAHLGGLVVGYIQIVIMDKLQGRQMASRKKKTRNLRLIVNNEEPKENPKDPRYWN